MNGVCYIAPRKHFHHFVLLAITPVLKKYFLVFISHKHTKPICHCKAYKADSF